MLAGRPVEAVESAVEVVAVEAVGVVPAAAGRRRYFSAREYPWGGWRLRDRDGRDCKKKPHTRKPPGDDGDRRRARTDRGSVWDTNRTGVAVNGGGGRVSEEMGHYIDARRRDEHYDDDDDDETTRRAALHTASPQYNTSIVCRQLRANRYTHAPHTYTYAHAHARPAAAAADAAGAEHAVLRVSAAAPPPPLPAISVTLTPPPPPSGKHPTRLKTIHSPKTEEIRFSSVPRALRRPFGRRENP